MLDHHLQRGIVYRLAFAESLRFSELKPDTIENKLFTYHLKKVLDAGYVAKDKDGHYSLTPEGRRLGVHVLETQNMLPELADSVLFLVIRRMADGAWLFYRRNTHPLKDRVGFMHCRPNSTMTTAQTAAQSCREKTGLSGVFKPLGGGYFRVYEGNDLESFTHFTLMVCDDASGELLKHDDNAEYFWSNDPDFASPEMLPNMPTLVELYLAGKPFFVEKTIDI
jgi:hypothetical protein